MTWHKVPISLNLEDEWLTRRNRLRECIKWCNDNISSEKVLWKFVADLAPVGHGMFYFAHADQAIIFRLSMGV